MASYIDNGNKLDWALPFQRTGDFPLDRSSMFSSYADAVKYAAGNSSDPDSRGLQGSSYVGQIITVFENNVVNVYKIEADRTLTLVGAGAGGTDDYEDLDNKPSINNVTLIGDKTSSDLGLASQESITEINSKIPNQASRINQLADKDFVNSSISTATATFRGTYDSLSALQATEGDKNDYAFYRHTDAAGNTVYDRYKYVGLPETRVPEGYTELYSIGRTNGGSYIDTGITIKSNYSIYTKINFMGTGYYTSPIFFGVKDSQSQEVVLYRDRNGSRFVLRCNSSPSYNSTNYTNGERIVEIKNNTYYIDGTYVAPINIPDIEDGSSIYLFGMNNNGTNQTTYGTNDGTNFSICSFKVWDENGDLILDLVPCLNYENRTGMYDVVSEQFLASPNGIAFTTTAISTDKWEYEYSLNNSSFTSEQWAAINSGVTSNTVSSVANIETLIPSQATIINQLADKDYVNTSISTATAEFKGTFTSLQALQATDGDRNDYAFYSHTDSAGNTVYDRYKYVGLPDTRVPVEYTEVYSIGVTAASGPRINTGIVLKNNYSIETTMTFGAVNYYTNRYYWGVDDGTNYFRLQKPQTSVLKIDSSAGGSGNTSIDNAEYLIEVKNNKFYIDGSLVGNAVVPNIGDNYPLYLFGYNNQGSLNTNGTITASFHTFKVWDENGNIILDLVPCRNYENQAGMYDVVSGQFFGGSFSTTPLSTDRWVYEYTLNNSSFTAAQWATINSGLTSQTGTDVANIKTLIPSQASAVNQLADKDYVDSSISTATATFRGTFTSLQTLQATNGDRNDYAFYSHTDTAGNTVYDRYKYVGVPDSRVPEGYTERLYLTQTRYESSYIDTGYKVQSTDKIVIKYYGFEYVATEALLLGAKDSNNNFFQLRKDYGAPTMYLETNNGSVSVGNGYNKSFIIEAYDGKVYVSDIDGENKQLKGSLALSSVDANLYVFRSNNNGTLSTDYDQGISIGDFTIYDSNDNKVLELVPCTDSLSANGYYETVGGRFIEPTDGTLSAQAISTDKWLFEYSLNNSSFTSAQWAAINSGVTTGTVSAVSGIQSLIPSQAGINNQLADKGYVETSISTATASFKGTFTSLTTLQSTAGDRNDYAFYAHQDSSGNTVYDRYKYVGPKEVILPAGYTQVERISGNYINLNIAPRNDWHFILKVSSPQFAEWPPAVPVFGVQSGNTRYDMYKPSYEDPLYLKTTAGAWGKQVSNNDIHTIEVKSNRAMYIDGSLTATLASTTSLPTEPVYLLGINSNGSAWTQNNVFCYGLTIYDNEENLLMDLVPCIRDQDGSIGVYDLSGAINPDTNSPFYAGATSSSPLSEDKWEYEYSLNNSSFTSAQWAAINSGITSDMIPSTASSSNKLLTLDTLPIYNGGVQNG